jgi:hypothetical protein
MSTIFILKEILDLLYEESKRGELVTTDVENRLRLLEKQLEEKNKELSRLYTENIRLENTLRKYESEFELLSNMPIIPVENSVESDKSKSEKKESLAKGDCALASSEMSEKTEKESEESKSEKKENFVETEMEKEERKKTRREYLTEYQRKYRKAKREQKMEMKV